MSTQDTATDIAETLRVHRKAAQLTQQELAILAGVGKTAVFDIEHGKPSVQLDTLLKILKVLNINLRLQGPFTTTTTQDKSS